MCGRAYQTFTEEELRMRYANRKDVVIPELRPNYNMAPTQMAPILRVAEGGGREIVREIVLMRWGLVPPWAKDLKIAYSLINARSETVLEKPTYRKPFEKRRCIVPVTGFFEWKALKGEKTKIPYRIFSPKFPILSFAGLWESKKMDDGQVIESFTILTCEANDVVCEVHDRMPVILAEADEERWLTGSVDEALALLKPAPDDWLETVEVSTLVNSPKNNVPDVLRPAKGA